MGDKSDGEVIGDGDKKSLFQATLKNEFPRPMVPHNYAHPNRQTPLRQFFSLHSVQLPDGIVAGVLHAIAGPVFPDFVNR